MRLFSLAGLLPEKSRSGQYERNILSATALFKRKEDVVDRVVILVSHRPPQLTVSTSVSIGFLIEIIAVSL